MPLGPEHASNIDRFFTAIKSLNELDKIEIRNVVAGALNPTRRESNFTLNYHRAVINIELLLTLKDLKQFQAIVMLARSIMETGVEISLMAKAPGSADKIQLFTARIRECFGRQPLSPCGESSAHSDRHHVRNRLAERDAIRTPVLVEFCLVG